MEGETREGLKRKRTSREKGPPRNGEKEMWERKRRGGGK